MVKNNKKMESSSTDQFNAEVYMQGLMLRVKNSANTNLDVALRTLEEGIHYISDELAKEKETVFIVNAGRMNHGKSSLLNSILGRNEFKVNDIRETVTNKTVEFKPGVYLIDTPGLSANSNDDSEAFNIYAKANCILFVHSPRIGELHSEEVSYLRRLKELFPKDFLSSHMVLVLTFKEEFEEGDLEIIRNKILEAVRENLGIDNVRVFAVSNSRYLKSCSESNEAKKEKFLKASGIDELKNYINEQLPSWMNGNMTLKQNILDNCRKRCAEVFKDVSLNADNRIKKLSAKLSDVKENETKVLDVINQLDKKLSKLKSMRSRLENKRTKWQTERNNY